jgi:hypothetical protein
MNPSEGRASKVEIVSRPQCKEYLMALDNIVVELSDMITITVLSNIIQLLHF